MALVEPDNNYAEQELSSQDSVDVGREVGAPGSILDPGFNLTLRPMQYPVLQRGISLTAWSRSLQLAIRLSPTIWF